MPVQDENEKLRLLVEKLRKARLLPHSMEQVGQQYTDQKEQQTPQDRKQQVIEPVPLYSDMKKKP